MFCCGTQERVQTARDNVLSFIRGFKKNPHHGGDALSTRQQALKEKLLSWADKGVDVVGNTSYQYSPHADWTNVFRWIGEADKTGTTPTIGLAQIDDYLTKKHQEITKPKAEPKKIKKVKKGKTTKSVQTPVEEWNDGESDLTDGMENRTWLKLTIPYPTKPQRQAAQLIGMEILKNKKIDFKAGDKRSPSLIALIQSNKDVFQEQKVKFWIKDVLKQSSRRRLCADSVPELGIQAPACPHAALAAPETSGLTVASVAVGSLVLGFIVYKANQFWRSLKTSDVDETLDCESQ